MADGNATGDIFGGISRAASNAATTVTNAARGAANGITNLFAILTANTTQATNVVNEVLGVISNLNAPFSKIQDEAVKLARSAGLAANSFMATSTRVMEQNRAMSLSMKYNVSSDQIVQWQEALMSSLGRNVAIDMAGRNVEGNPNFDSELENLVAAGNVFGTSKVTQLVQGFDKIGKSMNSAAKVTGKLYAEASQYGLNLQKYSENFIGNLGMVQTYNFRNGVEGLREMARHAAEIRQDMKQVASFAEKVGTVTGAVETAANLQVLGGSFAAFANPLAMLNESLTDMNGLQQRLTNMTEGAATYNSVTHQIEMDPVTRQLMKRAAQSMGVDPNNLIDQAYAQARRTEISRQLDTTGMGNIRPEFLEMVKNMGEIDENGQAGVTIGNKFITLSDLAGMDTKQQEALQTQLIEETRSESEDIKDIAQNVKSLNEYISGRKAQAENAVARNITQPGVIKGRSVYDESLDTLNSFNEQTIEAAARLDRFSQSMAANISTSINSAIGEILIKPFSEDNIKGIAEQMKEGITSVFGESDWTAAANGFIDSLASGIDPIVTSLKASFEKHGFTPFVAFGEADQSLVGSEPSASSPAVTRRSYDDVVNVLLAGGEGGAATYFPTIIPSENYDKYVQDLFAKFQANDNTIPGEQVAQSVGAGYSYTGTPGQDGKMSYDYNLNLSGTFTFVGDKGEITKTTVENWLKNSPEFANQVANIVKEAMQNIESQSGQ